MPISFTKLQGAGNGYIVVDGRESSRDWPSLAISMSDGVFGVGSDGLLVVQRSASAQARMRVFNPDGSEAEMSGNGIRLFAKFTLDRGIVEPSGEGKISIETGGGVREVWPTIEGGKMTFARVAMGEPTIVPELIPVDARGLGVSDRVFDCPLSVGEQDLKVTCLSIGNPHCVVFTSEPLEQFPLARIGPLVENHWTFPERINFEVVRVLSRNEIAARVFERGAGETPSSGSGSTACVVASRLHGLVDEDVEVTLGGGRLRVQWPGSGQAYLEGPAVEVFSGEWPE